MGNELSRITYEELIEMLCLQELHIGKINDYVLALGEQVKFLTEEVIKARMDAMKSPKLKEDKRTRILIEQIEAAQGEATYTRQKLFDHFKEHKEWAEKSKTKRSNKYKYSYINK
jgi:hypothetical protein